MEQSPFLKLKQCQWWVLVAINILFLIVGQAAAILLGRVYYDKGGNSKWMATVGFLILCIPLFFLRPSREEASSSSTSPSIKTLALLYFVLGLLVAADNMLYSVGLWYLSASTYSLICVTQLAFYAIFTYFLNSQFTALILNSAVILSLLAALIAINDDSSGLSAVSKGKFLIGFLTTLGASALYSLLLSLMRFSFAFQKVLKKETFCVVLEMQICTSMVASCVSIVGLFASGEWKSLNHEMKILNCCMQKCKSMQCSNLLSEFMEDSKLCFV